MKRILGALFLVLLAGAAIALAQAPPAGQKTLAATLEVYAFPQKGQEAAQQSQDEAACYEWAVQNTGSDPFALQKQAQHQAQQTAEAKKKAEGASAGAGAKGAVGGAAAGAVIGEIASDDAGKGAAVGAAAGAIAARRRARAAEVQAEKKIEQQGQQQQAATQEEMTKFRKAFSACLEAKGYLVKY